ncbi:hypothetical protein [Roseovarius aquimarinus]|uniref:Uncharacterized protein n=1 Tax=Roseovarius aquimarinus TaxID=1229156 RepID=A0ABW7IC53_9RHOB
MSHTPEPDFDKEFPRHTAWRRRLAVFAKDRPIAFAFRIWLFCALFSVCMVWIGGADAFARPSAKLVLSAALLGWVIPFIGWIRAKKAKNE